MVEYSVDATAIPRVRPALPNGFSHRQIASAVSPRELELILLPTEKCNFRCTYCYEDFEIGRMSETTQRAVELLISRRISDLQNLRFSWFGGEPLVATNVVLRLAEFAYRLSIEHGVSFQGGLTTNGYLLDKPLAQRLVKCKQNFFQVTLDGWGETHDVVRRRADGRPTFAKIWSNLSEMRALEDTFEVCIRVHVRPANVDNLKVLMRRIGETFGADRRFRVDFQALRDLGGEGGKTVTEVIDNNGMRRIKTELVAMLGRVRLNEMGRTSEELPSAATSPEANVMAVTTDLDALGESAGNRRAADLIAGEPYICYAAKPNSLLIRADGRVGKCTVAFSDARNTIGKLNADGSVTIDRAKLRPWIHGLETLNLKAVNCPLSVMAFPDIPPKPVAVTEAPAP